MSNFNTLTLTLVPNSVVNSTTVTLGVASNTQLSSSYSSSMQFAQNVCKRGSVIDDSNRLILAGQIIAISIA